MIEFLESIDISIFYFINNTLSNKFFDKIFPFLTEVKHWYLVYLIAWLLALIKGNRLVRISAIAVIFVITAADQFSSFFLKNLFERVRPCNVLPDVNILTNCTGSFSFPSSHAVNNFAVAIFFTYLFPKQKWYFLTIAILMAFSRPYVGVHYPSDVLGGAIIGGVIGYIFAIIAKWVDSRFSKTTKLTDKYERIEFK